MISPSLPFPIASQRRPLAPKAFTLPRFGNTPLESAQPEKPIPTVHTDTLKITRPSGKTLSLRRWWPLGSNIEERPKTGPTVLVVPGYGGRTGWGAKLAEKLLSSHPLMYGVNIPYLDIDPAQREPLKHTQDLMAYIQEAAQWAHEEHKGPIIFISTSLGALATTHLLGAPQQSFPTDRAVFIAPAYRPAPHLLSTRFYTRLIWNKARAMMGLKPQNITVKNQDAPTASHPTQKKKKTESYTLSPTMVLQMLSLAYGRTFQKVQAMTTPTLIVIPEDDKTCSTQAMQHAFELLGSQQKGLLVVPKGRHNMVMDPEMDPASEQIRDWLLSLEPRWEKFQLPAHHDPKDSSPNPTAFG
jgi:alpha-beta hydrolase superfamily lysophospholipase